MKKEKRKKGESKADDSFFIKLLELVEWLFNF